MSTSNKVDSPKKNGVGGAGHWLCSCRWIVAYLGFTGAIAFYLMRINMSVAVVCMTTDAPIDLENNSTADQVSPEYWKFMEHLAAHCSSETNVTLTPKTSFESNGTGQQYKLSKFTWSRQLRGWVLSSFYISYIPMQLPFAWLSRKFGAKKMMLTGGLLDVFATFLTPAAARYSVYLLMVVQAIKGIGHAAFHPCMSHMWSSWAPPLERTKLSAFVLAGNSMGSILAFAISGYLCEYGFDGGWPSLFYVYGMYACLWLVLWMFLVYDSPEVHPRISAKEKQYLLTSTGIGRKYTSNIKIPWLAIARSPKVWAVTIGDFCYSWMLYIFLSTMPQYMKDILRFDIKKNGLLSSLPFIGMCVMSIVISFLADALRKHHIFSTKNVRRLAVTIAVFVPAVLLIPLSFMDCTQPHIAVALICLAVGLSGANRSGATANQIDIAPRYAGIMMGISNTICNVPGFIVPTVVAAMTSTGLPSEWQRVFFVSIGVQLFGWLFFMVFCSGEVQPWASTKDISCVTPVPEEQLALKIGDMDIKNSNQEGLIATHHPKHKLIPKNKSLDT